MNGNEEVHGKSSVGGTAISFTVTFADQKDEPTPTGLKNVKITVSGDRASGMNGDETVYGNATVTGTPVVFGKKQSLVQSSEKPEPEAPVFKDLKD